MDSCHPHHPPVNPYAHKELDWKEVICITSFFGGGGAVFWCCLPFTSGFHSLLVRWSLTTQCCLATALWCLIIPFTGNSCPKWRTEVTLWRWDIFLLSLSWSTRSMTLMMPTAVIWVISWLVPSSITRPAGAYVCLRAVRFLGSLCRNYAQCSGEIFKTVEVNRGQSGLIWGQGRVFSEHNQ